MENYLKHSIENLLIRTEYYKGYLFHLDSDLKNYTEILIDRLNKQKLNHNFIKGCRLIISDFTSKELNKKEYSPTKGYKVTKENYKDANKQLIQFISCTLVAQSYEALETFIKDIIIQYFENNNQIAFETIGKINCNWNKDIVDWGNTVRKINSGKNNSNYLNIIRRLSPDFRNAETNNNLNINLEQWFNVISTIRHSITHSESILENNELNKLKEDEFKILELFIDLEDIGHGSKRMIISKYQADELMTFICNYSIQIFKWLTISLDFKWNLKELSK